MRQGGVIVADREMVFVICSDELQALQTPECRIVTARIRVAQGGIEFGFEVTDRIARIELQIVQPVRAWFKKTVGATRTARAVIFKRTAQRGIE